MAHPGTALNAMRTALGLSQEELADMSGKGVSYLSQVERGRRKPSPEWLRDVQDVLSEELRKKETP